MANDDFGAIGFAAPTSTISETAGNVLVTITRSATLGSVGVSYATTGGTAISGADFSTTSGTVTFADGVAQQTISIPIINDTAFESLEAFSILLSSPTNGGRLDSTKITHTVTIQSDDAAPPVPQISFFITSSSVEKSAGVAVVSVRRSASLSEVVSVSYGTSSGTATAGSDYTESSGVLNFAAFETERSIVVPVSSDAISEGDESFTVALSSLTGGAVLGANSSHTVTILGAPTLALSHITATTSENAGIVALNVVRTGSTTISVSVQYSTSPGTTTDGADFTPTSGTLTFAAGLSSQTITVPILRDLLADDGETFTVNLSAPIGALLGAASAEITITDVVPAQKASFHGLAKLRGGGDLGGLTVNTTRKNKVTGKFLLNGDAYSFNGPLDGDGAFAQTFSVKIAKVRVQHTLALQRSADGLTMDGTFTLGDGTIYDIEADADAVENVAAGAYNALLSSDTPVLRGFVRAVVKTSGVVSVKGCLPDGKGFTHTTHIATNENVAIFAPIYSRDRGYLGGTASIADGEISAPLSWKKPPIPRSVYPDGFDNQSLALSGALYTFTSGQRVLNDFDTTNSSGNAHFTGGGLANDLIILPLTYSTGNKFSLQNAALKLAPRTGLMKGWFEDGAGVRYPIKGIAIPSADADVAEGYFISGAATGVVRISAE